MSNDHPISPAPLPLAGVRVLELAQALSGPFCAMQLADLGADVIKIEAPGGDDARQWGPPFVGENATYFLSVNRNKRSITLNLKDTDDLASALALAASVDIVIENWKPGTAAKLGLGPEQLRARDPALIYCSISGFGARGPDKPGYDQVIQGMAGWMSLTGPPEGTPYKVGLPIADMATGLFATIGILGALLRRKQTGIGAFVDIAMFDSMAALLTYQAGSYFKTGKNPTRQGNMHVSIVPYGSYKTSDGFINICVGNDAQWERLCDALGERQLKANDQFKTNGKRVANRNDLSPLLEAALEKCSTAELTRRLEAASVPCGPIWSLADLFNSELCEARGLKVTATHPTMGELTSLAHPWLFDDEPQIVRHPPPLLGEHRQEILDELATLALRK